MVLISCRVHAEAACWPARLLDSQDGEWLDVDEDIAGEGREPRDMSERPNGDCTSGALGSILRQNLYLDVFAWRIFVSGFDAS